MQIRGCSAEPRREHGALTQLSPLFWMCTSVGAWHNCLLPSQACLASQLAVSRAETTAAASNCQTTFRARAGLPC